jgi:hypothetical protein
MNDGWDDEVERTTSHSVELGEGRGEGESEQGGRRKEEGGRGQTEGDPLQKKAKGRRERVPNQIYATNYDVVNSNSIRRKKSL